MVTRGGGELGTGQENCQVPWKRFSQDYWFFTMTGRPGPYHPEIKQFFSGVKIQALEI
jgi:hypothetical protein